MHVEYLKKYNNYAHILHNYYLHKQVAKSEAPPITLLVLTLIQLISRKLKKRPYAEDMTLLF